MSEYASTHDDKRLARKPHLLDGNPAALTEVNMTMSPGQNHMARKCQDKYGDGSIPPQVNHKTQRRVAPSSRPCAGPAPGTPKPRAPMMSDDARLAFSRRKVPRCPDVTMQTVNGFHVTERLTADDVHGAIAQSAPASWGESRDG